MPMVESWAEGLTPCRAKTSRHGAGACHCTPKSLTTHIPVHLDQVAVLTLFPEEPAHQLKDHLRAWPLAAALFTR